MTTTAPAGADRRLAAYLYTPTKRYPPFLSLLPAHENNIYACRPLPAANTAADPRPLAQDGNGVIENEELKGFIKDLMGFLGKVSMCAGSNGSPMLAATAQSLLSRLPRGATRRRPRHSPARQRVAGQWATHL